MSRGPCNNIELFLPRCPRSCWETLGESCSGLKLVYWSLACWGPKLARSEFFSPLIALGSLPFYDKGRDFASIHYIPCFPSCPPDVCHGKTGNSSGCFFYWHTNFRKLEHFGLLACLLVKKWNTLKNDVDEQLKSLSEGKPSELSDWTASHESLPLSRWAYGQWVSWLLNGFYSPIIYNHFWIAAERLQWDGMKIERENGHCLWTYGD